MNTILDTVPLTFNDYLLIVALSATVLIVSEIIKYTWSLIKTKKANA